MTEFADGNRVSAYEAAARLGTPLVVKDRRSSGGRGVHFVDGEEAARTRTRGRIAEKYVDAAEVSVESFLDDGEVLFTNVTQYLRKAHVNMLPANLAPDVVEACRALNYRVVRGLRITWGITHCEMYLTPSGPLFGEIALRPPGGYIMELLALAYGFNAWDALVAVELSRSFEFPAAATRTAAAVIFHPGPGTVTAVRGASWASAHPGVVEFKMRVAPGDSVDERVGVGQDVGRVMVAAPSGDEVEAICAEAAAEVQIDLAAPSGNPPAGRPG
jgi:biotin carboxylase